MGGLKSSTWTRRSLSVRSLTKFLAISYPPVKQSTKHSMYKGLLKAKTKTLEEMTTSTLALLEQPHTVEPSKIGAPRLP